MAAVLTVPVSRAARLPHLPTQPTSLVLGAQVPDSGSPGSLALRLSLGQGKRRKGESQQQDLSTLYRCLNTKTSTDLSSTKVKSHSQAVVAHRNRVSWIEFEASLIYRVKF